MKLALRATVIVAIASALVYALDAYCYTPLRCNAIEKQIEEQTQDALGLTELLSRQIKAQQNLRDLEPCADIRPTNVNYYMIKAANFRIAGDTAAAVREYERALHYDRRPEIYLNLGLVLLEAGKSVAGQRALVAAGLFDPRTIDEIPYESVRTSVRREVSAVIALKPTGSTRGR